MKTSHSLSGRMNVASEPLPGCRHAVALLKELNMQREFGQFCDCVIQLHVNPGKLFLAHKNVLAASSPVLASLLTSHGALLDLQIPCLSPDTMDYLLDFIYTGNLPPKNQEHSVLSVAVALQMQELQYALMFRSAPSEALNICNKSDRKQHGQKHEEGSPQSEKPLLSCLSEAVPVIRHASACGKLSPMQQPSTPNYDLNITFDMHGEESEKSQSVDLPSYRHQLGDQKFQNMVRNDDSLYEPLSKKAKVVSHVSPSDLAVCHQTESPKDFAGELLESIGGAVVKTSVTVSPKTLCAVPTVRQARHKDEDLSPHSEASKSLSDASGDNGCHSPLHVRKAHEHTNDASNWFRHSGNEHGMPHASLQLSDVSASIPVENCHCISVGHSKKDVLCHLQSETDTQCAAHVAVSRENVSQAFDMQTCRAFSEKSGLDLVRSIAQADTVAIQARGDYSSLSERSSSDQEDEYDLYSPRVSGVHTYQGQVSYHCLSREPQQVTELSNSDEEGLDMMPTNAADSHTSSTPGVPLSEASNSEPSAGPSDLSKAQLNPSLNQVPQPYQCNMCERAFSQRGSLNRHLRSHLGVRPYSCPQCPMTFSRQYRVMEHMRVHQRGCEDPQRTGTT